MIGLMDYLSDEEKELFNTDIGKLDAKNHVQIMMYGIANYAGKQELLLPKDDL